MQNSCHKSVRTSHLQRQREHFFGHTFDTKPISPVGGPVAETSVGLSLGRYCGRYNVSRCQLLTQVIKVLISLPDHLISRKSSPEWEGALEQRCFLKKL
jgi:hypothetical protein